jgi:hypothetical protein
MKKLFIACLFCFLTIPVFSKEYTMDELVELRDEHPPIFDYNTKEEKRKFSVIGRIEKIEALAKTLYTVRIGGVSRRFSLQFSFVFAFRTLEKIADLKVGEKVVISGVPSKIVQDGGFCYWSFFDCEVVRKIPKKEVKTK